MRPLYIFAVIISRKKLSFHWKPMWFRALQAIVIVFEMEIKRMFKNWASRVWGSRQMLRLAREFFRFMNFWISFENFCFFRSFLHLMVLYEFIRILFPHKHTCIHIGDQIHLQIAFSHMWDLPVADFFNKNVNFRNSVAKWAPSTRVKTKREKQKNMGKNYKSNHKFRVHVIYVSWGPNKYAALHSVREIFSWPRIRNWTKNKHFLPAVFLFFFSPEVLNLWLRVADFFFLWIDSVSLSKHLSILLTFTSTSIPRRHFEIRISWIVKTEFFPPYTPCIWHIIFIVWNCWDNDIWCMNCNENNNTICMLSSLIDKWSKH